MAVGGNSRRETTGVIIVGGGPTGVVLSALLGQMQVPNIILEREAEITTDPRGIALDEDGVRVLQAVGIYDRIFNEIGRCPLKFLFLTGRNIDMMQTPLTCLDYETSEGGTGHPGFITHKQPVIEASVRDVIYNNRFCELRSSSTVTQIDEAEDEVTVTYTNQAGQSQQLTAPFLVGADGKTGYVRKKHLEPKGVLMQKCEGVDYEATWVALNWQMTLPNEKTHPDFPLWKLGYTPEEVYDLFFPKNFRFLCNPSRPSVCGRFGLPEDRLWRFEFVVQKGEDGMKMASMEETSKIIYPYITHPGSRYRLSQPIRYPLDCIKTLRSRPFHFSARSCNRWAMDRVIVCGDAAHVFPPFGGQGIASGFRDALGLAWRLALLHREAGRVRHEPLLEAWYKERKQQFDRSLAATVRNGEQVTASEPFTVFWREWSFWAMQLIPSWRRHLEKGPRAEGMVQYRYENGFGFVEGYNGGLLLPQVYAYDFRQNDITFSDDLIFSPTKKGLFQLVLVPDRTQEIDELVEAVKDVENLSSGLIHSDESTILLHHLQIHQVDTRSLHKDTNIARIASGDEFAAHPRLCKNRPPPLYYDPYRIRKEVNQQKFIILRPDRFVYAAVSNRKDLEIALQLLKERLHMQ